MKEEGATWVIVPAAAGDRRAQLGEGRWPGLVPEQFFSSESNASRLRFLLDVARRLAPGERTVALVAEPHRAWWQTELASFGEARAVVLPESRGTASDLIMGLTVVLGRDAGATVIVLAPAAPLRDAEAVVRGLARAADIVREQPGRVALLALPSDELPGERRLLVPARAWSATAGGASVSALVEPQSPVSKARLLVRGAVPFSGIFVVRLATLLLGFERALPELLRAACVPEKVRRTPLPARDLARDLLARMIDDLTLVRAPTKASEPAGLAPDGAIGGRDERSALRL